MGSPITWSIGLLSAQTRGSQTFFVPGTPDEVKEKSGTPRKRNLENTQPTFVLLIEKKLHSTAWLY
jgi:hypothetical protein